MIKTLPTMHVCKHLFHLNKSINSVSHFIMARNIYILTFIKSRHLKFKLFSHFVKLNRLPFASNYSYEVHWFKKKTHSYQIYYRHYTHLGQTKDYEIFLSLLAMNLCQHVYKCNIVLHNLYLCLHILNLLVNLVKYFFEFSLLSWFPIISWFADLKKMM